MSGALWTWDKLVPAAVGTADGAPQRAASPGSPSTRARCSRARCLSPCATCATAMTSSSKPSARAPRRRSSLRNTSASTAMARCCACAKRLEGLRSIAAAARRRTEARIVAVTGSVGKTGTKEALRNCLSRLGPTHAAEKSFNNHWGVPLTLARMPAEVRFGVFEIGMNHAGEITPLTALVRPHVAIVTTVEPVHLEFFGTTDKIAEAKAEIFSGLEPGGVAVLNRDNAALRAAGSGAPASMARASSPSAVMKTPTSALKCGRSMPTGRTSPFTSVAGALPTASAHRGRTLRRTRLPSSPPSTPSAPMSRRLFRRSPRCALPRAAASGARSRCRAAPSCSSTKATTPIPPRCARRSPPWRRYRGRAFSRRIAVLGDMLELGENSGALHAALNDPVDAAEVDLVFACGRDMQRLFEALPAGRRGAWAPQSAGIAEALGQSVRAGDVVMVKGSLGSRMAPLVEAADCQGRTTTCAGPRLTWA